MFGEEKIEEIREKANLIFGAGVELRWPIGKSMRQIRKMIARNGLPQPDDLLAFVFKGACSDREILDQNALFGGW